MSQNQKYDPPKHTTGDTAHLVSSAILSLIPGAAELFRFFVIPPLEKRQQKWMEEVGQALRELEQKREAQLEELQNNPRFITVLVQATQAAMHNHQEEKINALRNVIVNSATGIDIDEDLQLQFVRFVDELTPSHLALLQFFADHEAQVSAISSYEQVYQFFLSESKCNLGRDEFMLLCTDLTTRILLHVSPDMEAFEGVFKSDKLLLESQREGPMLRVTSIGRKFLKFITRIPQQPISS